jgi:hypothetical protein
MRRALITLAAAAALAGCAGDDAHTTDTVEETAAVESAESAAPTEEIVEEIVEETVEIEFDAAALPPVGKADAALAAARFERMKELVGDWVLPDGDGTPQLSFDLTANGSAVIETVFPGQQHEMVSVYTLDSGRLVMTHYCAMGNQPYMVATQGGTADVIRFECQKAGNTQSHADPHMHLGVFTIGDGMLKTEWTMFKDLTAGQTVGFELVRGGM